MLSSTGSVTRGVPSAVVRPFASISTVVVRELCCPGAACSLGSQQLALLSYKRCRRGGLLQPTRRGLVRIGAPVLLSPSYTAGRGDEGDRNVAGSKEVDGSNNDSAQLDAAPAVIESDTETVALLSGSEVTGDGDDGGDIFQRSSPSGIVLLQPLPKKRPRHVGPDYVQRNPEFAIQEATRLLDGLGGGGFKVGVIRARAHRQTYCMHG